MKHTRIWVESRGKEEWRELLDVSSNEYGDVVLTLDGGELWQFTPDAYFKEPPSLVPDDVIGFEYSERRRHSGGDGPYRLILGRSHADMFGNVRVIQPAIAGAQEAHNPRTTCRVCGWYHDEELTAFRDSPNGERLFVSPGTQPHTVIKAVHEAIKTDTGHLKKEDCWKLLNITDEPRNVFKHCSDVYKALIQVRGSVLTFKKPGQEQCPAKIKHVRKSAGKSPKRRPM